MKAEVTVWIEVDPEEVDNPNAAADEIMNDARSFLGQYGEVSDARVRLLDGDTVAADTGAPVAPVIRKARARRAAKADGNPVDADAMFVPALPGQLPEMDPNREIGHRRPPPQLMGEDEMIADALDNPPPKPKRRSKAKGAK